LESKTYVTNKRLRKGEKRPTKGAKTMSKEVNTYTDLLQAIGQDLKPRLEKALRTTGLGLKMEAIDEALNAGPTLELIAEFVGYRHVELKREEQGK